jgi:ABC-type transport system involved in multi-copper enzyme maturation permease subunit
MLTRRPSRIAVYGGKVLALGVVILLVVLVMVGAGAATSAFVAHAEGTAARQASVSDIAVRINQIIPLGEAYAEQQAAQITDALPRALQWPPVLDIAKAVGATWLILAVFAAFGLFLGTLTRGTALAIGVGLVWLLVVEAQIEDRARFEISVQSIYKWMFRANANSLAIPLFSDGSTLAQVSQLQAALVLAVYTTLFLLLGALLFHRRDVT